MFLINRTIAFLPERQRLKNTETGDEMELSLVDTALLDFLLRHVGKVATRDAILEDVFSQNNVSATDGNLNRHIMLLRKSLIALGCEDEVIITVPKTGFQIGPVAIDVTAQDSTPADGMAQNTLTTTDPGQDSMPTSARLWPRIVFAMLSFLFFLGAALYYFRAPAGHITYPDVRIFKTERYQQCEVSYTRGTRYTPPQQVITHLNEQGAGLTCNAPAQITLWRNDTSTQTWDFTTICDALNKCRGMYVYHQK